MEEIQGSLQQDSDHNPHHREDPCQVEFAFHQLQNGKEEHPPNEYPDQEDHRVLHGSEPAQVF